jgi:hypothetical protein
MSRLFIKLMGLFLLIAGIYFLAQNIFFASSFYNYFWRSLPASASVLCLMGGVLSLIFFRRQTGNLGWILIAIGAIFVFLSGGVFLRPTSLWQFLVSFTAIAAGYKLLSEGRVNF